MTTEKKIKNKELGDSGIVGKYRRWHLSWTLRNGNIYSVNKSKLTETKHITHHGVWCEIFGNMLGNCV